MRYAPEKEEKIVYLVEHAEGFCLDGDIGRPGTFSDTLCGCRIMLPLSVEKYNSVTVSDLAETGYMCADCVRVYEEQEE